ncbi:MAG: ATP-dependent DNA helicase RecG [Ruminococcaceae bacterium]|nr:ATP-dependent DNA helicase RecG [Oscillospiraceae bacterium]
MTELNKSVQMLPGVGTKRAEQLAKLGIETVEDLLYHFPRAYQNRGKVFSLGQASLSGQVCATVLTVGSALSSVRLSGGRTLSRFTAFDSTGKCVISFFNQNYLKDVFRLGCTFRFYGKVEKKGRSFSMTSPAFEPWSDEVRPPEFYPIYPLTAGLSQKNLQNIIGPLLARLSQEPMEDPIPEDVRQKYSLMDRFSAFAAIHMPSDYDCLNAARNRFAFEELFLYSLGMKLMGMRRRKSTDLIFPKTDLSDFFAQIPFALTDAQKRTVNDIYVDMTRSETPMARLVSGDVGSGKTVCAAAAAAIAIKNGYQCALMVPTEILANQHYNDLQPLFAQLGYRTELLTGSLSASEKRRVRAAAQKGEADLLIGTHALITDDTVLARPGLVITDEQHRFGVAQRQALSQKGSRIHTLVMTATPIPRTLAHILYGDLDVSVIDTLPPGRQVVDTFKVNESYRTRLNAFIRKQVNEGHQVYIVCPAVEQSAEEEAENGETISIHYRPENELPKGIPLQAAVDYAKALQSEVFPDLSIGLLHGKMKAKDKDAVMADFVSGKIHVLVSTTVIEVGVNVPNATLMIIENAERFGLAQLHQLRGRVGRGSAKSYCVLMSNTPAGSTASARLDKICQSHNGYEIASFDLELRGPGDFFPQADQARQSGEFSFRFAGLAADVSLAEHAAAAAAELLRRDPTLKEPDHLHLQSAIERLFRLADGSIS